MIHIHTDIRVVHTRRALRSQVAAFLRAQRIGTASPTLSPSIHPPLPPPMHAHAPVNMALFQPRQQRPRLIIRRHRQALVLEAAQVGGVRAAVLGAVKRAWPLAVRGRTCVRTRVCLSALMLQAARGGMVMVRRRTGPLAARHHAPRQARGRRSERHVGRLAVGCWWAGHAGDEGGGGGGGDAGVDRVEGVETGAWPRAVDGRAGEDALVRPPAVARLVACTRHVRSM